MGQYVFNYCTNHDYENEGKRFRFDYIFPVTLPYLKNVQLGESSSYLCEFASDKNILKVEVIFII